MTVDQLPTWASPSLHTARYDDVTAHAPRHARRWAADELAPHHLPDTVIDTALLVVSELVTNVYLHAPGSAELTLDPDPDGRMLILTCADRGEKGDIPPYDPDVHQPAADDDSEHGRGLTMVARMSCGYFVRPRMSGGKRIVVLVEIKEETR